MYLNVMNTRDAVDTVFHLGGLVASPGQVYKYQVVTALVQGDGDAAGPAIEHADPDLVIGVVEVVDHPGALPVRGMPGDLVYRAKLLLYHRREHLDDRCEAACYDHLALVVLAFL